MRVAHMRLDSTNEPCMCGYDNVCSNPPNGVVVGSLTRQSHHHVYNKSSSLWELYLSPKLSNVLFFKLECVQGRCQFCGFHCLPLCEKELQPTMNNIVEWWKFEKVLAGKTRNGEQKEVTSLETKVISPKMFVAYATPKFIYYVMHDQVAKWQDVAYTSREMKEGETMSLIDFAKNNNLKKQNEVQKQHWYNF